MSVDLERLGEERRLIFENVANGVPTEQIMAAFHRSEADVMREVAFVAKKLREYRFKRHLPPLACETVREIRINRLALLETVGKLGPRYLSSSLELPTIYVGNLADRDVRAEAQHRTGQRIAL